MVKSTKKPSASTNSPSNPIVSIEVNAIQSMQSSGNKKKGNGKNKIKTETNRKIPNLRPRRMTIKEKGKPNIPTYCVVEIISLRNVLIVMKLTSF